MIQKQSKELTVLLRYCIRNPKYLTILFQACKGGIRRKCVRSLHRLMKVPSRLSHYPKEVKEMVQNVKLPEEKIIQINSLPRTGWEPANGTSLKEWRIPLATQSISLRDIKWDFSYNDREDIFALNRFIWILRWLSLRPPINELSYADGAILNWIEHMKNKTHLPGWESYSVSERIVNWLLYLCATRGLERISPLMFQTIASALFSHLKYLLYHLEFHFFDYSNHILNNARALYIGGRLLKYYQFSEMGEKLLRLYVPVLIDNGFHSEGSSHYQLLITKTLTECVWCAGVTEDTSMYDWLIPMTKKMQYACCLFSIGKQAVSEAFPRMGDVSPDFPVKWFYYKPDNLFTEKESWFNLWDQDVIKPYIYILTKPDLPQKWIQNGWIRVQNGRFTSLAPFTKQEDIYPLAHGHLDFGSFMVYDDDLPLLIDLGRFSYEHDDVSVYGFNAQAHNVVAINGLPVLPQSRSVFKPYSFLISQNVKQSIEYDDQKFKIEWQSKGFDRFAKGVEWKRMVLLNQDAFSVVDEIYNPKGFKGNMRIYFHLYPELEIIRENSGLLIKHVSGKKYKWDIYSSIAIDNIEIKKGEDNFSLDGWYFPEYGVKIPAPTIIIHLFIHNNVHIESHITAL